MINKPLVSIILPTYNRAHLLPRAVDSVLAQTFPYWELIIWNDGSVNNLNNFYPMEKHAYLIMAHDELSLLKKSDCPYVLPGNDIFIHVDAKVKNFEPESFSGLCQFSGLHFTQRIPVTWGHIARSLLSWSSSKLPHLAIITITTCYPAQIYLSSHKQQCMLSSRSAKGWS
jgi:cellulose synthase/poly-beta-1,6-N-acetylglucosamine synthase-like glycosyltransferase